MSDCGNVQKTFVPTQKEEAKEITQHIKGIEITDVAAEKIKTFVEKENKTINEWGLFIKVTKDGCSGQSYIMDIARIDEHKDLGAKIFEKDGCHIMVEKTSYFFITGSQLDYTEALTGSGFKLVNPNIKKTCSCGSSFSV